MLNEQLLDTRQAARILGCTEAALELWRRKHTGPAYIRLGCRLVRYAPKDLQHWLTVNTSSADPDAIGAKPESR